MEGLVNSEFWRGKRVLVTGHTGFKGGWLSLWLQQLGAVAHGFSLEPPTTPSLFVEAKVAEGMGSTIGDVRDLEVLRKVFAEFKPEIALHLAAQPLVRLSYQDPVGTYATNVLGTVNFLEAARGCASLRALIVITTDKCYENREWCWSYRENDALGGYDPYSNSKACAELAAAGYRSSFFSPARHDEHHVALATARAGNVIGGGDWAQYRLIPDLLNAFEAGEPALIRSPDSVRPWQHVLEPLRGYLTLAERLYVDGPRFGEAWNFGPADSGSRTVGWIADYLCQLYGGAAQWRRDGQENQPHEARMLRLDWSKAAAELPWRPALALDEALRMTVDWRRAWRAGRPMRDFTLGQIADYARRSQQTA